LRKSLTCSLFFVFSIKLYSQELNAEVVINYNQVNQTYNEIFEDFERSVYTFLNSTRFSNESYDLIQKIDCNFIFTIVNYEDNQFVVNLDVSSYRTGYESSYNSLNFNFRDVGINFSYQLNEPIIFSYSRYTSDLASLLSFYSKIIIGFDKDSFELNSGFNFYSDAKFILDKASNISRSSTWNSTSNGGRFNKYWLVDNLISNNYDIIKSINYNYYRNGLDLMTINRQLALLNIKNAINMFTDINRYRPNSILKEIFFQSKNDEIFNIFNNDLEIVDNDEIKLILNKISPFHSNKWDKL
tara:strand:- start:4935 stop:5831 length:897 start_codon:yes stop_codon:yes gene_type:complete